MTYSTFKGSWLVWSSGQNQEKWAPTLLLVLPWQGLCSYHGLSSAILAQLQSHLKLQVCVHPTFSHLQRSSQWPWIDRCVPGLRRCLYHCYGNLQVSIKLCWNTEVSSLVFPLYLMYILCPTSNLQCPGFSITNGYVGSICMMSAPQVKFTVHCTVSSVQYPSIRKNFWKIVNPQVVRPEEGQTAASLMVALLGLGLGSGAFLSNYFVMLI